MELKIIAVLSLAVGSARSANIPTRYNPIGVLNGLTLLNNPIVRAQNNSSRWLGLDPIPGTDLVIDFEADPGPDERTSPPADLLAVLYESTKELNEDLQEYGDIPISRAYYGRIVRTAALEIVSIDACTYGEAVNILKWMQVHIIPWIRAYGTIAPEAKVYRRDPPFTFVAHVRMSKWPE